MGNFLNDPHSLKRLLLWLLAALILATTAGVAVYRHTRPGEVFIDGAPGS